MFNLFGAEPCRLSSKALNKTAKTLMATKIKEINSSFVEQRTVVLPGKSRVVKQLVKRAAKMHPVNPGFATRVPNLLGKSIGLPCRKKEKEQQIILHDGNNK